MPMPAVTGLMLVELRSILNDLCWEERYSRLHHARILKKNRILDEVHPLGVDVLFSFAFR